MMWLFCLLIYSIYTLLVVEVEAKAEAVFMDGIKDDESTLHTWERDDSQNQGA
jgi:hypothetical protein